MKRKKISREYFKKFWRLYEEGRSLGLTNILHCSECKKEIELSLEKVVADDLTIQVNAAFDITNGRCECTTWEVT